MCVCVCVCVEASMLYFLVQIKINPLLLHVYVVLWTGHFSDFTFCTSLHDVHVGVFEQVLGWLPVHIQCTLGRH